MPGEGKMGLAPWEYTIGELFSDAGYATALYGKWHVGNTPGREPNDQGFDEWWGILNTSDEAAYSQYPLWRALGLPAPQIWEDAKDLLRSPRLPSTCRRRFLWMRTSPSIASTTSSERRKAVSMPTSSAKWTSAWARFLT